MERRMKRRIKMEAAVLRRITGALFFFMMLGLFAFPASAHEAGDTITSGWGYTAGTYNSKGQIVMNVCTDTYKGQPADRVNANALNRLCDNDEKKTIIIPSGSDVKLLYTVKVGSNTTIIAKGATLTMTAKKKGILNNTPVKTNYNSLKNVLIQGGTWMVSDTVNGCSVMRFCHGTNLTIDGATIIGNYEAHEIALVAMKDTVVKNCKLKCRGKINKNSVEEALQIDVASPKTAPGIARSGSEFVKGQTCTGIRILNNEMEGSRGLCANAALYKGSPYKNKFHDKITITGNTLIGRSAEGCALYNVVNATVKNNVIKTYSTRKKQSYGVGLNITIQGKASSAKMKNAQITLEKNKVYGYRQGIQVISLTSSKYKKVTAKSNKCYASKKKDALKLQKSAANKISSSKNKSYKR